MELKGKVVVITRGINEVGLPLAVRFLEQGALVVLADKNEKKLAEKVEETGAIGVPADTAQQLDIKSLVDKVTRKLGRIDLFISNATFLGSEDCFMSESERNHYWHTEVMAQMYAAKYVLPQMIKRSSGYLLNVVPATGLLEAFRSEMYNTLNHPALGLAERMAAIYRNSGVKVSVLCLDTLRAAVGDNPTSDVYEAIRFGKLADLVIDGIQKEQFMISTDIKKTSLHQQELNRYEMYRELRA